MYISGAAISRLPCLAALPVAAVTVAVAAAAVAGHKREVAMVTTTATTREKERASIVPATSHVSPLEIVM